jgi:hypothetical protein
VIELTDGKTLWYNYNFFKGIFSYTSMDVVDNQQYITKWVEDNIINKELTYATLFRDARDRKQQFEDAIENGVRELYDYKGFRTSDIKDTIQNGVKKTNSTLRRTLLGVDDIIQNGIKETRLEMNITEGEVDDIIQDGVKETIECNWNIPKYVINEVLNDGVKHTEYGDWLDGDERLDDIINNGVRDTQSNPYENESWIEGVIKKGVRHTFNTEYMPTSMVEDIIQSGVKETNPVDVMKFFDNKMEDALQNGVKETKQKKNALLILDTNGRELILESHLVVRDGVKETSHRQFLKTYDVKDTTQDGTEHDRWILDGCDDPVDVVLDNGVKITTPLLAREYTGDIDEVLGNGVKTSHPRQYVGGDIVDKVIDKGVIETHDDVYHHKGRIDGVIKNGVKETKGHGFEQQNIIDDIVKDGVKETKTPGKDGDILSTIEWMKENKSNSYTKMIDDVIENGVKETKVCHYTDPKTNLIHVRWPDEIVDVIENGEKINGTYAGGQRQSIKCKSVVEYGTKNPTD